MLSVDSSDLTDALQLADVATQKCGRLHREHEWTHGDLSVTSLNGESLESV